MKPNETKQSYWNRVILDLVGFKVFSSTMKLNKPFETKSEQKLLFSKIQKSISNAFVLEKVSWFGFALYETKPDTNFLLYILEGINNAN